MHQVAEDDVNEELQIQFTIHKRGITENSDEWKSCELVYIEAEFVPKRPTCDKEAPEIKRYKKALKIKEDDGDQLSMLYRIDHEDRKTTGAVKYLFGQDYYTDSLEDSTDLYAIRFDIEQKFVDSVHIIPLIEIIQVGFSELDEVQVPAIGDKPECDKRDSCFIYSQKSYNSFNFRIGLSPSSYIRVWLIAQIDYKFTVK